jgi:alpha-tubulin suppressor-like RCC1 family protein
MAASVPSAAPMGALGIRPTSAPAPAISRHRMILAAGGRHSCTATVAGSLHCWGANDRGQVGDGTATTRTAPVAVASVLTFEAVAAGLAHSCALTRLGDVYCWGSDSRGQLGDATTVRRSAPVRVAGVDSYVAVTTGATHSCGVTSAAMVRCWGANDQGQLGDGTRTSRPVPTAVILPSRAIGVAAGGQHSCAVGESGEVHCWGVNRDGQLGIGLQHVMRELPSSVAALPVRASTVGAGLAHSCALGTDGSVWCWGRNESGQLGDGTRIRRPTPARVPFGDAQPLVQVVSGGAHTCALGGNGGVWCWGRNTRGAIGDGTTTNRMVPTRVRLPAPAVAIAAGTAHSCATTTSSQTFCWGDNLDGQLGDASRSPRLAPTRVRYRPGVSPVASNALAISQVP